MRTWAHSSQKMSCPALVWRIVATCLQCWPPIFSRSFCSVFLSLSLPTHTHTHMFLSLSFLGMAGLSGPTTTIIRRLWTFEILLFLCVSRASSHSLGCVFERFMLFSGEFSRERFHHSSAASACVGAEKRHYELSCETIHCGDLMCWSEWRDSLHDCYYHCLLWWCSFERVSQLCCRCACVWVVDIICPVVSPRV